MSITWSILFIDLPISSKRNMQKRMANQQQLEAYKINSKLSSLPLCSFLLARCIFYIKNLRIEGQNDYPNSNKHKVKYKQPCKEFELGSLIPFPKTLDMSPN